MVGNKMVVEGGQGKGRVGKRLVGGWNWKRSGARRWRQGKMAAQKKKGTLGWQARPACVRAVTCTVLLLAAGLGWATGLAGWGRQRGEGGAAKDKRKKGEQTSGREWQR